MRRQGFTLIELLVVLFIIALVSAAVIPAVMPALSHRQVSESARILQASIEGSRDAAIRANAPRGIRLVVDPAFPGSTTDPTAPLAYNRIVPIEPAPDYSEGRASIRGLQSDAPNWAGGLALRIEEARVAPDGSPNAPTSWYWNVRVGDRIQVGGSGRLYTIVGPVTDANAERFVNVGPPGTTPTNPQEAGAEYLFLVNGVDDDGDGYTDEGFDGIDNDADTVTDESGVGGEWEAEVWTGAQLSLGATNVPYIIRRRPVPTQGARVVEMPSNIVIDASSWSATRERSRLPINPDDLSCELVVMPDGSMRGSTLYSTPAASGPSPFVHFWLSERGDVQAPAATGSPRLPLPDGMVPNADVGLKGDRRLVTVNMRSGNVTTNTAEEFDTPAPAPAVFDVNRPFYAAQRGSREAR